MEFVRGVLGLWGLTKLNRKGEDVSKEILHASGAETVQVLMTLPKLPEGYEYTGEYKRVSSGGLYICPWTGLVTRCSDDIERSASMVHIVRKAWQFPEALKTLLAPGWVTKDEDGLVFWREEEPVWDPRNSEWNHVYGYGVEIDVSAFPCLEEAPGGSSSIWKVGDHEQEEGEANG